MPKKKVSPAAAKTVSYEDFLRSVKLYSLALAEMSSKLDREKYWKHRKKSDAIIREISSTYSAKDVEDDHFNVEARLDLTISVKNDPGSLLSLTCTYHAHFHASVGCHLDATENFAKSEAKIIVWPYFRQLVSDVTGRMNIPPITIPMTLD